jgi:ADP-heptose:LPS heptosyltransferase
MSNILIIKHGSLGDLIQANGAIADIKQSFPNSKILLLTGQSFIQLMSGCPYIDGVILDKRLPRWNLFYLHKLKKLLMRYNFSHVFDLQNSSRTKFYKNFLLKGPKWSSTETTLTPGEKKRDLDNRPVLDRMKIQLNKSGVKTNFIKKIDLAWAILDVEKIIIRYTSGNFILIFPFCSKKHPHKKWPYYKELVKRIREDYNDKYSILVAPGPHELEEAKSVNAKIVLNNDNSLSLNQLISLINRSTFIIANDTGPAHISSHLKKNGIVLFGSHTSPEKVSIENENFEAIKVSRLEDLSVEQVFNKIKKKLD